MKKLGLRKILPWLGIALTGLFGVVLFGGDKITSGTMMMITAVLMALPIRGNQTLRRVRIGFVCVVFAMVVWNISTTDLPSDFGMVSVAPEVPGERQEFTSTGIRFLDQLIHIFNGFLQGRVFVTEPGI